MNKLTKKDYIYMTILVVLFILIALALTNNTYLYGSNLDWASQHYAIPDYFRTLFYSTKDLLPDFAFNIGSGQNIYNLSYYGLLSPIIFISYLLPSVSMSTYISISTIICVLISTILLYIFLHNKKYNSEVCFLSSLIFIASSAISFHSHRHIMFINYMPFLILGLYGVDKKFDNNKGWLLTLSTFLMIMTSYYYSIGGIFCLFIYALYRYLNHMNKVTIKSFFKTLINIACPIIVAVLASAIITLPTLATLLYNRADSNTFIKLTDLLIPNINPNNFLYNAYCLGLSSILVFALINYFKKNKANIVLGIILTSFILFDIFNYIFNGTMYIDAKSLIPFLPLYIFVIAEFIKDTFDKKLNLKVMIPIVFIVSGLIILEEYKVEQYLSDLLVVFIALLLYYKTNKKVLFIIPIFTFAILNCYFFNTADSLMLKYTTRENEQLLKESLDLITDNDKDFYRVSNDTSIAETPNNIYQNINYYNSTIYSSVSNQKYNQFYYDTLANNIPLRNRALTVTTPNLLSLMLTNNKYIITTNKELHGYEALKSKKGINIYRNENVLPLGFATSNVMSYEDFELLSDQVKQEALLNVIVADTKTKNKFVPNTKEVELDYTKIIKGENIKIEDDNSISINAKENLKITYELPEAYKNKIIFIRFKMNKSEKYRDLSIQINNVKNKLTESSWKYYNGNTQFDYVLATEEQDKLVFSITKGKYNISDFETYILDYSAIENCSKKVDKFIIDKESTKGDYIKGNINVINDGYFMISIPYDKGFNILVDNKKIEYELVDNSFIGFPITEGDHKIEIEYKAPMKNISLFISLIGTVCFIVISILESKRKF